MNTLVTYLIAKLLKTKGFDEPCYDAYNSHGNKFSDGWCEYIYDNSIGVPFTTSELKVNDVAAPTIADVVMWLYKEHGIWISVKPSCNGAEWYSEMFTATEQVWNDVDKRHAIKSAFRNYKSTHSTLTEAYLAAIEYCINELI